MPKIKKQAPFKSYKEKKTFQQREKEVKDILMLHPNKVPMIIERFEGEKHLPELLKVKYLVPDHVPFGEIVNIIRRKLQLHPSQGFFLLVNGDTMVSNATLIGDLYIKSKHFDGYLYLTYVSHDIFGGLH